MTSQDREIIDDLRNYVGGVPTRRQYLSSVATAAAVGIAGCAGGDSGEGTTEEGETDTTTETGETEADPQESEKLVVGDLAEIETLDPAVGSAVVNYHVLENTQERLFNVTPDLQIETELATDLEISNGGTTWTMPIREGVMFHEPYKRELVADDFVKVFEWISNEDNGSSYISNLKNVNEVIAPDDYTLQLELEKPVVDMKIFLADRWMGVWPMEAREEDEIDLRNHPVGTGPFVFDEWVPESHTQLTKNTDYWMDDRPYFDTIEIRPIPKSPVRLTELQTGEVEFMEPGATQPQQIKNDDDLVFDSVDTGAFNEIKIQTDDWRDGNPFADSNGGIKARQGVIEAIDYPSIVESSGLGVTTPSQNPFPEPSPWHLDYNPYSMEANPDKAKQLFDEAGLGTDFEVQMYSNNAYDSHQSAAKIIQQNLKQIGLEVSLELSDWATELTREGEGRFDMAVNGWPMWLSPDAFLTGIFHSEGDFNTQGYANDEVDSLLEEARIEQDQDKRKEMYDEIQRTVIDEVGGYIFLQHWPVMKGYRKYIKGYENHPYNYLGWNFRDVYEI